MRAKRIISTRPPGRADWLYLDIMDGIFVPNISFGPAVVSAVLRHTRLPFDVQMMVRRPTDLLSSFVEAGANWLTPIKPGLIF